MLGKTVSHYTILEKLGEGGMGVVYKAQDLTLHRFVALKFLPPHLHATDEERNRLIEEARAASALNHPNICVIHSIGEFENQQFIDLEYIDGQTLGDKINHQPLPLKDALSYAIQIGEALQEAHNSGIVHRDIKADNVMVNSRNQVKVMDFGLARLKGAAKLTHTSSTAGTLAYMAPEQIQGGPVDARSDIFAFGVLLYEMLTGRLPFRGEHEASMVYSIVHEDHEPLQTYLPGASADLTHILNKALEKDPESRYQSVTDMVVDLRRLRRDSTRSLPSELKSQTAGREAASPAFVAKARRGTFPGNTLKRILTFVLLTVAALAAVAVAILRPWNPSSTASGPKTLVVLPFENQGDPSKEYFADGLTDEITSRLSGLSGLAVIARSSAREYRNSPKSLKQIGEELGVDYALMGTIRWSGSGTEEQRIRVNPELVRVNSRIQIWSQPIEAKFSDAFTIQANVASEVARALNLSLLVPEKESLTKKPTENAVAFDYYLKGLEYEDRGYSREPTELAIRMYQQAINADPRFASAYAKLSRAYSAMYWFFYDRSELCLEKAKDAVDKALEFEPTLSDALAAKGWYLYHGRLDYDHALEQFTLALRYQPNNADVFSGIASVQRRQGNMLESIASFEKSVSADPRSSETIRELAETYTLVRRYARADSLCDRALILSPDNEDVHATKILNTLIRTGDPAPARAELEQAFKQHVPQQSEPMARDRFIIEFIGGSYDRSMKALSGFGDRDDQFDFMPNALLRAEVEQFLGDPPKARPYYEAARGDLERRVAAHPDDERYHSALGIALAGLGRKDEALKEARRGVELLPVEKEAWRGTYRLRALAQVYMMVGEQEEALDLLERLLTIPSELSGKLLQADPIWTALRANKRFQAILRQEPS